MGNEWRVYRRNGQLIKARELQHFTVLLTRSGIFWGRRGDYLAEYNGNCWIIEWNVFPELYTRQQSAERLIL